MFILMTFFLLCRIIYNSGILKKNFNLSLAMLACEFVQNSIDALHFFIKKMYQLLQIYQFFHLATIDTNQKYYFFQKIKK